MLNQSKLGNDTYFSYHESCPEIIQVSDITISELTDMCTKT